MNDHIETHKYSIRMESNTKALVRINLTHVLLKFFKFHIWSITKSLIARNFRFSYQVNYKSFSL